jgi:hypothetical protein
MAGLIGIETDACREAKELASIGDAKQSRLIITHKYKDSHPSSSTKFLKSSK